MSRDTKIKDIKAIRSGLDNFDEELKYFAVIGTEGCIPKNRDVIALYADEPCVEACRLLYDLNIQTYSSGGNIDGVSSGKSNAFISIVYDTLSDENKKITQEMIDKGLIEGIMDERGRNIGFDISFKIPIDGDSLVGDVSDKLVQLASMFHEQDVLYGKKTIDEIRDDLFKRLPNGSFEDEITHDKVTEEEMRERLPDYLENECSKMHTSDGVTYFVSEDLLNKHLDYVKTHQENKTI